MEEKEFNSLVQKVLNQDESKLGWCYKIPDPSYQELMRGAASRPFDLVGTLFGKVFSIESKMIKGFSSFNFNGIRPQQDENLTKIIKTTSDEDFVGMFIAFWEPRKRYEFIFIDYRAIMYLKETGKGSLLKKDLQKLKDADKFIQISKSWFELNDLKEKRIDVNDIRRIIE